MTQQIQLQAGIALQQQDEGRGQLLHPDLLVGLGPTGHHQPGPSSPATGRLQRPAELRRRQIGKHLNRLIRLQLVPALLKAGGADDGGIAGP